MRVALRTRPIAAARAAPFPHAQVVARSGALLGHRISYKESCAVQSTPGALAKLLVALALLPVIALALGALLLTAPGRALLRIVAPPPGRGPSEATRRFSNEVRLPPYSPLFPHTPPPWLCVLARLSPGVSAAALRHIRIPNSHTPCPPALLYS